MRVDAEVTWRQDRRPEVLGASILGTDELHARLRPFAAAVDRSVRPHIGQHAAHPRQAPLYFASVDIRNCFDSLPQARLLEVTAALTSRVA